MKQKNPSALTKIFKFDLSIFGLRNLKQLSYDVSTHSTEVASD